MAAYWTNKGKADVMSVAAGSADLRMLLVTTAPADAATAADLNFVSDVVANECSGTGYARKTLSGIAISEDDTNNLAKLDASDPSVYAAANFGTPVGAWVFRQVTNDADNILWTFLGIASPQATNGGDYTVVFNANGISTAA